MKTTPQSINALILAGTAVALLGISTSHAANGTWTADSAGNWSDTTKWDSATVANGADFTALFDDVITANRTITLDSSRTIGNITAADTSHNFTIQSNTLTLDVTSGSPTINVASGRTLTISSVVAGNDGFTKTGGGTATLSGSNTLSGDVTVSAGVVNYGQSGSRTLNSLSGSGDFLRLGGDNTLSILDASAFTGNLRTFAGGNSTHTVEFRSLGDSVGAGNLQTGGGSGDSNQRTKFRLYGDVGPLTLNNRSIEILPKNPTPSNWSARGTRLENNNGTAANKWVIKTDLINVTDRDHEFELIGSNTGDNEFAGAIGDSTRMTFYSTQTGKLSLIKDGAGKWILSGASTYTGDTTIINGALEIRGAGQLGAGGIYPGKITSTDTTPSPFTFDSSANTTISGVISGTMELIKDGAGTLSLTNANTYTGNTTVNGTGTLSLGDGTNNSNLDDFSTVSVASGAFLNLNYAGSDTVLVLNLGGSPAAAGKWGRTGSIAGLGADFESALITGDGLINNLGGVTTSVGAYFWDGGTVNIGSDGNATGIDADGTWDTTILNWDAGFTAHAAWPNTTAAKAYFNRTANSARTITLGSDITLGEIDLKGTVSTTQTLFFGSASEDNTLNFGGASTITTNNYYVGFRSGISGAPTINYEARSGDNSSKLTLAPAGSLTMTLGAINMQKSTGSVANCILELGGTDPGNSASSVTWSNVAQQLALNKVGAGTWTLSGGWDNSPMGDSQWKVQGGTLILDGNFNISHRLDVESGGTLKGNATLRVDRTGATEHVRVLAGGTMAPGTSVGTINVNDKTEIAGTLEIEVSGATADLLGITGDLVLTAATDVIKVVELGSPTLTDYLIVTYTGTRTGTFDTEDLPAGYSVDYSTANEIHLLAPGVSSPYDTWASGYSLSGGDALPTANTDGDLFNQLLEFGFGTNPNVSDSSPLSWNGVDPAVAGGPMVHVSFPGGGGVDFKARFMRRKDHGTAGSASYAWEFSSDLLDWESSSGTPTWLVAPTDLADDASGDYDLVEVPYPLMLDNGKKARFFRVSITAL